VPPGEGSETGRERRVLILDAGGVLVTEPIPALLRGLASKSPLSLDELERGYYERLYFDLWRGSLPEEEFWSQLVLDAGLEGAGADWRSFFLDLLRPLPATEEIERWSRRALVYVLSNHLPQWLEPVLEEAQLTDHLDRLLISSVTGHVKPEREAFAHALRATPHGCVDALLVDDNERNLTAARSTGIDTVLADETADWCAAVDRWLDYGRPHPEDDGFSEATLPLRGEA